MWATQLISRLPKAITPAPTHTQPARPEYDYANPNGRTFRLHLARPPPATPDTRSARSSSTSGPLLAQLRGPPVNAVDPRRGQASDGGRSCLLLAGGDHTARLR
jgi:hypothetical protein